MSRALATVVAMLAMTAHAQVAGLCAAGKHCTVSSLRATAASGTRPTAISLPRGSYVCFDGTLGSRTCSLGIGQDNASTVSLQLNGVAYLSLNAGTGMLSLRNATMTAASLDASTYGVKSGQAFSAFSACTAGNKGTLLYDSTNGVMRYCDGGSWRTLAGNGGATNTMQSAQFASVCFGACVENVNFAGGYQPRADDEKQVTMITCSWGTAGTGGASGVVVRLYDNAAPAEVCSCTLGACAATGPLSCSCSSGPLSSGRTYTVQLSSATDCEVNPANIVCNTE